MHKFKPVSYQDVVRGKKLLYPHIKIKTIPYIPDSSSRDPNLLRHTRHAMVVHRKYKPVARHHDSRVAGDVHVPHVADVPGRGKRDTSLIGIDSVRVTTEANEGVV